MAVVLLGLLLAACSSASTPAPVSAEELRTRAVATLRELMSAHFEIAHASGGTDLGAGLTLISAEGDALFPDRAKLTAKATLAGFGVNLDLGIVQIGRDTYMRDPISRIWRTVDPDSLPFDFVGMHNSVADAFARATELSIKLGGNVDGVATSKLTGLVRPEDLRGLVPGAAAGAPMALVTWIGIHDALPRRVQLTGRLIADDHPTMTRLLELRDFDKEVIVEPPI